MSTQSSSSAQGQPESTRYLARKAAGGDDVAFTALYERVSGGVRCAARLRLAECGRNGEDVVDDVMSEALAQTFERIRSGDFDPDCSDGSLRNYLAKIVRNRAIDLVRSESARIRNRRRECTLGDLAGEHPDLELMLPTDDETPSLHAVREETWDRIRSAMLALPERDRRALDLIAFCGLSYSEIASELALPNSDSARLVVFRARRRLEKILVGRS